MAFKELTPEERLERDADQLLHRGRARGKGSMPKQQEYYLDRQLELREEREIPSGLKP